MHLHWWYNAGNPKHGCSYVYVDTPSVPFYLSFNGYLHKKIILPLLWIVFFLIILALITVGNQLVIVADLLLSLHFGFHAIS